MLLSAIVATDLNGAIGLDGQIPWYLPADLKYFKKTTIHHHVIMGKLTYASIGRPLANRINIIITRDIYFLADGCLIAHSIEEALNIAADHNEKEAFIIGGSQIYQSTAHLWDNIYLTKINHQIEKADSFFPDINLSDWDLITQVDHFADERNKWPYSFIKYSRKTS